MFIQILLFLAILVQTIATVYALKLVRATKYNSIWILFIIGFSVLSVERIIQLLVFAGLFRCLHTLSLRAQYPHGLRSSHRRD